MNADHEPTATTYLGLFFVALATVMYEIVLTRIFSVTMWYHFAFVAISIAMFGMTVGAIIVYLRPALFTRERVTEHLALSAVLFAVSAVVSFLISLFVPFDGDMTVSGVASTGVTYAIIAVPFVFSGVWLALALTKFPRRVGTLYAADLIGAATGCLWVMVTLNVTDGPTTVIVPSTGRRGGPSPPSRCAGLSGSAVLTRVVALAVLECPRCGGRRRIVGVDTGGQRLRARLERQGFGDPSAATGPSGSPPSSGAFPYSPLLRSFWHAVRLGSGPRLPSTGALALLSHALPAKEVKVLYRSAPSGHR